MSRILNVRRSAPGAILLAAAAVAVGARPPARVGHARANPARHHRRRQARPRHQRPTRRASSTPTASKRATSSNTGPTVAYGHLRHETGADRQRHRKRQGRPGRHRHPARLPLPGRRDLHPAGTKPPVFGKDKSFIGGNASKLRFEIARGKENEITVAYGGTAELDGGLTGLGNTSHGLILQADPYPYTAAFTTLLVPLRTNLSGRFLFKVRTSPRTPSSGS